ncbi:MAG: hypothetical protein HRU22_05395 [Gammaproteobacteria bacterium]|nr:hypothetical protein [Gammaproteobacteria bacterium]
MNKVVIDYLKIKGKSESLSIIFGSILESSWDPAFSDIDLVIFSPEISFYHYIDCYNDTIFDVFEMSLDKAFYFLTHRDPMWISVFSTGRIVHGDENIKLLLDTSKAILKDYKLKIPPAQTNLLFKNLKNSYKKLCKSINEPFLYHYFCHGFLNCLAQCLSVHFNISPMGMNKKVKIILEELPNISPLIQ